MGSEVARTNDSVVDSRTPWQANRLDVDMTSASDVRSVFGSSTSEMRTPQEMFSPSAENRRSDAGISMLSGFQLTDNERVVASDRTSAEAPFSADRLKLNEQTLESAKVRKREGYFQVADRLLGNDFNPDHKRALTTALKESWKANSANGNADQLRRGDQLLTSENLDKVLSSIQDAGLRERIRERLTGAKQSPPSGERERTAPPRQEIKPPERDVPPPLNPEPRPVAEDERSSDRGAFKSPFLKRYDEGDRFKGLSSVYWQGRETASGLPFNRHELTAASRELPFGTILKVTNPANGREVRVVVTDHGPFAGDKVKRPDGSGERVYNRVLDLSLGAANALGMGKTVKPLEIAVESIPPEGRWGDSRRNIHGDYRARVKEDVRRLSRRA